MNSTEAQGDTSKLKKSSEEDNEPSKMKKSSEEEGDKSKQKKSSDDMFSSDKQLNGTNGNPNETKQNQDEHSFEINDEEEVEKCIVGSCHKYYHFSCLQQNQNVDFYVNNKSLNRFRCPLHYCRGCGISGNSV